LRSALEPQNTEPKKEISTATANAPTLLDSFSKPKEGGVKLTFLDESRSDTGN
jgi:hypothetical protein